MSTLAEFMILSGADNRPPMLEKHMYNSWKSRMEPWKERGGGMHGEVGGQGFVASIACWRLISRRLDKWRSWWEIVTLSPRLKNGSSEFSRVVMSGFARG
ncbi:hypothetical protein Tco_0550756 [Tanacetum coccineum]